MDVRVVDLDALRQRTPDQIAAYLSVHDWLLVGSEGGASYWHKSGGDYEVMVPNTRTPDSYGAYVASAVNVIARAEDRSELDVLLAISQIEFDRQMIRSLVEDGAGSIGIGDGVAELSGVHAWMLSAASHLALREKRSVLPAKKPIAAQRFMERVRLGVPTEGSYVWSVLVPLSSDGRDEPIYGIDLGSDDQLFPAPRQVTRLLYSATDMALSAASNVIASDDYDVDDFRAMLPDGLTANLCQALADLGGERGIPYELRFEWGVALPERARPTIKTDSPQLRVMAEVAKDLRASEPVPNVQVEGSVVRLHREGNLGPGEVSILGSMVDGLDGRLGRYWVPLGARLRPSQSGSY